MNDLSWLEDKGIKLPVDLECLKQCNKATFRFVAPRNGQIIGSFFLETCIRRHGKIDIAFEMPPVCISHY